VAARCAVCEHIFAQHIGEVEEADDPMGKGHRQAIWYAGI
jgi:hypothetical protein